MSRWSIHAENGKYVVREGYVARAVASAKAGEEGAGEMGKKVFSSTKKSRSRARVAELEADHRQDLRAAAAGVLFKEGR